jgi:phage baseplate assembly protein W
MPLEEDHYGKDLRLLSDLDHVVGHAAGSDLSVVTDPRRGRAGDLARLTGLDDVKQAVLLRLLTPAGELAQLGHPEYGSRLHTLTGAAANSATLRRARLYVLEALAGEPRVKEVLSLTVAADLSSCDRLDIQMSLHIRDSQPPVHLAFQYSLAEKG